MTGSSGSKLRQFNTLGKDSRESGEERATKGTIFARHVVISGSRRPQKPDKAGSDSKSTGSLSQYNQSKIVDPTQWDLEIASVKCDAESSLRRTVVGLAGRGIIGARTR